MIKDLRKEFSDATWTEIVDTFGEIIAAGTLYYLQFDYGYCNYINYYYNPDKQVLRIYA